MAYEWGSPDHPHKKDDAGNWQVRGERKGCDTLVLFSFWGRSNARDVFRAVQLYGLLRGLALCRQSSIVVCVTIIQDTIA